MAWMSFELVVPVLIGWTLLFALVNSEEDPLAKVVCESSEDGYIVPDPRQCDRYVECSPSGKRSVHLCLDGWALNLKTGHCDLGTKVDCSGREKLQAPRGRGKCPRMNGNFPLPANISCSDYIDCRDGHPFEQSCGRGAVFDLILGCVHPDETTREGCRAEDVFGFKCPALSGDSLRFGDHDRIAHPTDCAAFYACLATGQPRLLGCSNPKVFDAKSGKCMHQSQVPGCENYYPPEELDIDIELEREKIAEEIRAELEAKYGLQSGTLNSQHKSTSRGSNAAKNQDKTAKKQPTIKTHRPDGFAGLGRKKAPSFSAARTRGPVRTSSSVPTNAPQFRPSSENVQISSDDAQASSVIRPASPSPQQSQYRRPVQALHADPASHQKQSSRQSVNSRQSANPRQKPQSQSSFQQAQSNSQQSVSRQQAPQNSPREQTILQSGSESMQKDSVQQSSEAPVRVHQTSSRSSPTHLKEDASGSRGQPTPPRSQPADTRNKASLLVPQATQANSVNTNSRYLQVQSKEPRTQAQPRISPTNARYSQEKQTTDYRLQTAQSSSVDALLSETQQSSHRSQANPPRAVPVDARYSPLEQTEPRLQASRPITLAAGPRYGGVSLTNSRSPTPAKPHLVATDSRYEVVNPSKERREPSQPSGPGDYKYQPSQLSGSGDKYQPSQPSVPGDYRYQPSQPRVSNSRYQSSQPRGSADSRYRQVDQTGSRSEASLPRVAPTEARSRDASQITYGGRPSDLEAQQLNIRYRDLQPSVQKSVSSSLKTQQTVQQSISDSDPILYQQAQSRPQTPQKSVLLQSLTGARAESSGLVREQQVVQQQHSQHEQYHQPQHQPQQQPQHQPQQQPQQQPPLPRRSFFGSLLRREGL